MIIFRSVIFLTIAYFAVRGCIPTTENNPSVVYPPCACSKPEIQVYQIDAGYSTRQNSTDCDQVVIFCSNIIDTRPVAVYFNGNKVSTADTTYRFEMTCDPTTKTYSALGYTGITTIGCTTADTDLPGGGAGGAAGEIAACTACNPKGDYYAVAASDTLVTQTVSADCTTISFECETVDSATSGPIIGYATYTNDTGTLELVDNQEETGRTLSYELTCDATSKKYKADGFDEGIKYFICYSYTP